MVYAVELQADDALAVERGALTALVDRLAGTDRPFVFTSGCWYYGPTGEQPVNEQAPANPPAFVARVPELERIVLDGAARYVGAGENHWPVVHVDDLADLYVRVLDRARAHEIFNAADSTTYRVRSMAESGCRRARAYVDATRSR